MTDDETSSGADGSSPRHGSHRWAAAIVAGYAILLIAIVISLDRAGDDVTLILLSAAFLVMVAPWSFLLFSGTVRTLLPGGLLGLLLLTALCAGLNGLILYAIVRRWTKAVS